MIEVSQPDKLVSRILEFWEANEFDEETIMERIQTEFKMSKEDAELAIELTKTGHFRAQLFATGQKYPKNNLNNNPIVNSAIKLTLLKLGRPELYAITIQQGKPWWKFW